MARRVGLDLDEVVDTAARIADAGGLDVMTLSDVARRLGIKTPSLYAHVDGREGLTRQLARRGAEDLTARLVTAAAGRSGIDAITAICDEYRDFARDHRGLYAAIQIAIGRDEDLATHQAQAEVVSVVAEVIRSLGIAEDELIPTIRGLRSLLHGFVTLETNQGFGRSEDLDDSFDRLVQIYIAGIAAHSSALAGPERR
jgi:AcrR family transcriptional regulator